MKKKHVLLTIGFLCLVAIGILFSFLFKQPYLYTGFSIDSANFQVLEVQEGGPADRSGIEIGSTIIRINDIDTQDFIERYFGKKNSTHLFNYSKLFEKGGLYRCEFADGSIHSFKLPAQFSAREGIRLLCNDDITNFSIGALFIILGMVLVLTCHDQFDTSPFAGLLYSVGICIATAITDFHNTVPYCVANLTFAQIATSFIAFTILRIVGFFYQLAGRNRTYTSYNAVSFVPFILMLIRFVIVAIRPISFLDGMLFYLPYLNLCVLAFGIFMFFILTRRIPGSSSLSLRFFLVGICFSLTPLLCQVFAVLLLSQGTYSYGFASRIFLPMLFVPIALICGIIQTRTTKKSEIATKVMILGCSTLVLYVLTFIPIQSDVYRVFLVLIAPFICFLLEKPITRFLFPQMDSVSGSFTDLEKLLFACDTESEMYALAADWLITSLHASFIVFYQIPDEAQGIKGKTLYQVFPSGIHDEKQLVSLIAERCADKEKSNDIQIHGTWGISSPLYKAHHIFGYAFIGARSQYEMFSNHEMRLIQPITRILMEALLVLDLKHQVEYINNMQNRIVYSFADMIESRDGTTGQHVKRTSLVVDLLTRYLKRHDIYGNKLLSGDYALISLAAPLHDIGKIKVPDRILSKPGKLTDEEFEIIKTHPVVGEKIINKTMFKIEDERYLTIAREMALYHHEKWNGKGYPEGLKGKKIPISARIMAVADVFDALCSERSYKEAYTIDEAFEIIDQSSGTHFEPVLVEAMHSLKAELTQIYEKDE